jgi:hypothetical protein
MGARHFSFNIKPGQVKTIWDRGPRHKRKSGPAIPRAIYPNQPAAMAAWSFLVSVQDKARYLYQTAVNDMSQGIFLERLNAPVRRRAALRRRSVGDSDALPRQPRYLVTEVGFGCR